MIVAMQCVVLLANCIMLVKITALLREWVATEERRARDTPDAAAGIHAHLDRINGKVERLLEGGVRIEDASALVASDLADSHERADTTTGPHGAAADAASRTGEA